MSSKTFLLTSIPENFLSLYLALFYFWFSFQSHNFFFQQFVICSKKMFARHLKLNCSSLHPLKGRFFFKKNKHIFQGRLNVSWNFFNLSLKCFLNVSYKFWFTPSPKNGYLQCAQLCLLLFFQTSSKLNLFSCRDGVYFLSMILSVCFDVKKALGKLL